RLRHRQVRARHPQPAPAPASSAEVAALAAGEHDRMMAALQRLSPRQREALVLRYHLDLSEREMAAAMGISEGSVKTNVHRGLAALQTWLEGTI
ncbi:MAG: RNA polymerase sigma factor, partial [Acidimicrobiales bacterium]